MDKPTAPVHPAPLGNKLNFSVLAHQAQEGIARDSAFQNELGSEVSRPCPTLSVYCRTPLQCLQAQNRRFTAGKKSPFSAFFSVRWGQVLFFETLLQPFWFARKHPTLGIIVESGAFRERGRIPFTPSDKHLIKGKKTT